MSNTNIIAQIVSSTELKISISPNAVIQTTITPNPIIQATITPNPILTVSIKDSGPRGAMGYTGSIGYTGSQGVIGYTGSIGGLGYTGSQGYIGYTGSQGVKGDTYVPPIPEDGIINRNVNGLIDNIQLETKTILIGRDENGMISTIDSGDGILYTFFRTDNRISSWEVQEI